MSAASSSSPLPSATVLTMNPPVCSGSPLTMARSRSRSASSWIRRDTPTWRDWGIRTMERPGMDTKEVTRAPLVPSDSFETCTRTSWPLRSISSMGATACRRGSASASPSASPSPSSTTSEDSSSAGGAAWSSAPSLAV